MFLNPFSIHKRLNDLVIFDLMVLFCNLAIEKGGFLPIGNGG